MLGDKVRRKIGALLKGLSTYILPYIARCPGLWVSEDPERARTSCSPSTSEAYTTYAILTMALDT